jgi:hypothetical protein
MTEDAAVAWETHVTFVTRKRPAPPGKATLRADVNQCVISVLFECKVEEEHEVLHKLNSAAS